MEALVNKAAQPFITSLSLVAPHEGGASCSFVHSFLSGLVSQANCGYLLLLLVIAVFCSNFIICHYYHTQTLHQPLFYRHIAEASKLLFLSFQHGALGHCFGSVYSINVCFSWAMAKASRTVCGVLENSFTHMLNEMTLFFICVRFDALIEDNQRSLACQLLY